MLARGSPGGAGEDVGATKAGDSDRECRRCYLKVGDLIGTMRLRRGAVQVGDSIDELDRSTDEVICVDDIPVFESETLIEGVVFFPAIASGDEVAVRAALEVEVRVQVNVHDGTLTTRDREVERGSHVGGAVDHVHRKTVPGLLLVRAKVQIVVAARDCNAVSRLAGVEAVEEHAARGGFAVDIGTDLERRIRVGSRIVVTRGNTVSAGRGGGSTTVICRRACRARCAEGSNEQDHEIAH